MDNYSVIDIEADGLLEADGDKKAATKIHCLSVYQMRNGVATSFTLTDYDEMKAFLLTEEVLIGHKIITYDIPMLEKFLGVSLSGKRQIDSLGLSWYLYPKRLKHGLDEWGTDLGIEKPPITDWDNQPIEVYVYRCEEDVKINTKLFILEFDYLMALYENNEDKVHRFINYLMYKLHCAREQEEVKWKLDVPKCEKNLAFLESEVAPKTAILAAVMPPVTKYKKVARPKVMTKKDGSLSSHGEKWFKLLKDMGLPEYHIGTVLVPTEKVTGNPGSHQQLKDWLFSLGWIPQTFKYVKEEDGSQRKVPQLSADDGSGVCESVKLMYEKEPKLEALEGLFILKHRITILKGFLEHKDSNDFLKAEIKGFTNTLRFQHTVIVNLPQIPKPYWEEVRSCLIAPDDNHVLCGSDMSGLEDNTGRHYMYYYDPEYVKLLMDKNYDPHLHIAMEAKLLTFEESEAHKLYDRTKGKEGKSHKATRLKGKKTNFASKYGAGPPKIALTANIPLPVAKTLHTAYWKINWSIKVIAANCTVKTVNGQMWLFNPVSQFWYSLRSDKDRFSTLNQGTGVYCFDSWVRNVRKQGIKNCGQFHDEIVSPVLKGTETEHKEKLTVAINQTNEELGLNVQLGISIDFGENYAQIH